MANLITLLRLMLVFVMVKLLFVNAIVWQLINMLLLIIVISLDGIDGIVARYLGKVAPFGAVFDIAADRVIELVLWTSFAYLHLISLWIVLIIITRGILVDSVRNSRCLPAQSPFAVMTTALGRFLVASRTMRFLFGAFKLLTFLWLLLLHTLSISSMPLPMPEYKGMITVILVYTTLTICLLRGIPVLLETIIIQILKR